MLALPIRLAFPESWIRSWRLGRIVSAQVSCRPFSTARPTTSAVVWGKSDKVTTKLVGPGRGIHRWHTGIYPDDSDDRGKISLEAAVAAMASRHQVGRLSARPREIPFGAFRVRFRGGPSCIPHVTDSDVLRNSLVPELISNRSVLIGWAPAENAIRMATPTSWNVGLTPLEYRGHALETLLANDSIRTPNGLIRLCLPILLALFGYSMGRTFRLRWTITIAVVAVVTFGGASWILLLWQHLWIPSAPLAASFFAATTVAAFIRVKLQQVELRRSRTSQLASDLAIRLQSKCSWQDVTNLISHFVEWDRMVLMELPSGMDHLRVVWADKCNKHDIAEKRRDIMRSPYSTAKKFRRLRRTS